MWHNYWLEVYKNIAHTVSQQAKVSRKFRSKITFFSTEPQIVIIILYTLQVWVFRNNQNISMNYWTKYHLQRMQNILQWIVITEHSQRDARRFRLVGAHNKQRKHDGKYNATTKKARKLNYHLSTKPTWLLIKNVCCDHTPWNPIILWNKKKTTLHSWMSY